MLNEIPRIGYGTGGRKGDEGVRLVAAALEAGYRHFDTAVMYGNEAEVGRAVAQSGLARDELWITTKIAPDQYDDIAGTARGSLDRLGVEQVDLLYLHWPSADHDMRQYLGEVAALQDQGLTRFIGVSNFTIGLIDEAVDILGGPERILMNQIELHPYLANTPIVEHCRGLGIGLTAYCPLARGRIEGDAVLSEIGEETGATTGQVALAWLLAKGYVAIPTSSNPERIAENLAAGEVALSPEQIARIDALDRQERVVNIAIAPEWDRY